MVLNIIMEELYGRSRYCKEISPFVFSSLSVTNLLAVRDYDGIIILLM